MTITITITKVPVAWHYKDGFTVQVIKLIINRATSWKETNKNSGTNYMWINIFCGFLKQKQHSFCCLDILHYITQVFPKNSLKALTQVAPEGVAGWSQGCCDLAANSTVSQNILQEGNFRWKFLKIFLQKEISRLPSMPDNIFSTRRWKYSSRTRGRGNKSLPRCRLSPSDKDRFGKLSPSKFLLNYTQLLF